MNRCAMRLALLLCVAAVAFFPETAASKVKTKPELEIAFMEWFTANGGIVNSVSLKSFEGMGRGVVADSDIQEGDTLLEVPLDIVICKDTIMKHFKELSPGVIPALKEITDETTLVSLFLVHELLRGEKSPWAPYINILPENILNFHLFEEQEIKFTKDPWVIQYHSYSLDEKKAEHIKVVENITPVLGKLDKSVQNATTLVGYYALEWGASIVDSRALTIHGHKYLVPFADMFNYKPLENWRESNHGEFFLNTHILGNNTFTVKADRPSKEGNQVFEDYGDNTNAIYAMNHGFVPDQNPFDCVKVRGPSPTIVDENFTDEENKEYSSNLINVLKTFRKTTRDMEGCIRLHKSGNKLIGTHQLLSYIQFFTMPREHIKTCAGFIKDASKQKRKPNTEEVTKCLTPADINLKKASMSYFIKVLEARLLQYGPPLAEENTVLSLHEKGISPVTPKTLLALRYRVQQKRLLLRCIEVAKVELENVVDYVPSAHIPEFDDPSMTLQEKIDRLNKYVASFNPPRNDIEAAIMPPYRVGARLTDNIAAEEVYLALPTEAVMDVAACKSSAIDPTLQLVNEKIGRPDNFHHLLVCLMWERFVEGTRSKWWPYLGLLPTFEEMESPPFFSDEAIELLKGSVVYHTAIENRNAILRRFPNIKNFVFDQFAPFLENSYAFTPRNYLWAHAILDSRGIWWDGQRHLVPLLDMVNCKQGPNPKRVHSTVIDGRNNAVTKTDKAYRKGEQIFENYGQPNHIYFTYHGFSLGNDNYHDCVIVPTEGILDKVKSTSQEEAICIYYPLDSPLNKTIWPVVKKMVGSNKKDQYEVIRKIVRAHIAEYPRTLAEDEALLKELKDADQSGPNHKASAVQFIVHEKVGLQRILDSVEAFFEKDEL